MSHAELNEAPELDMGDPVELGEEYARLKMRFAQIFSPHGWCRDLCYPKAAGPMNELPFMFKPLEAFRNEISPRNFLFRTRELEQEWDTHAAAVLVSNPTGQFYITVPRHELPADVLVAWPGGAHQYQGGTWHAAETCVQGDPAAWSGR
jgi:hypothetical protein